MGVAMMPRRNRVTAARVAVAVAILFVGSLALFWPGYVTYDGLAQYRQALSGRYDDWHPPIMAHLWAVFGAHGPAPMLVAQMMLYWLGLGGLAVTLTVQGRRFAALAILGIACWPPLLGWQAVVLKDTQMLGALLAASALVGGWQLRGRAVPPVVWIVAGVLAAYAVLVRANAVFAICPLLVMLTPLARRPIARLVVTGVATLGMLAAAGPINHRLLGAAASGVERTQATYDLAGIAARTGDPATGITSQGVAALREEACVRPFFWDPLGEGGRCQAAVAPLHDRPVGALYAAWAQAIVHNPIAYAAHRLAHLNSTERWLVPLRWYGGAPPEASEANAFGFGAPGKAAARWQRLAAVLVETPFGWPVLWTMLAVLGLAMAWRRGIRDDDPAARFAIALFASALGQAASFAVVSIASDLRYHLWAMAATAIGWVVLGRPPRGRIALAALAVVLIGGAGARLVLPQAPQTYAGMLG